MTLIPPNLLCLMSKSDRDSCGKGNELPEEIAVKVEAKAEKALQAEIRQYLNLRGVAYINPDMRKKSPLPEGWPDFTFAYQGKPIALECKVGKEKPRPEQLEMHTKMMANGWLVLVVRSLEQVRELLKTL